MTSIPCSIIQSSKILEENRCPPAGDGLNKPGRGRVRRALGLQSAPGKVASAKCCGAVSGTRRWVRCAKWRLVCIIRRLLCKEQEQCMHFSGDIKINNGKINLNSKLSPWGAKETGRRWAESQARADGSHRELLEAVPGTRAAAGGGRTPGLLPAERPSQLKPTCTSLPELIVKYSRILQAGR